VMTGELDIRLDDTQKFLCAVLVRESETDAELIMSLHDTLGDDHLFSVCERNKITSIAAASLMRCIPDRVAEPWRTSYNSVSSRVSLYMDKLDSVAEALSLYDIPLVALKNSGITRGIYTHFAECPMGDIDVLVRKSDFREAHSILVGLGFKLKFRSPLEEENLEAAEQGGGAEYVVKLNNGEDLWFELQWRPVAGRWIRPDQEPDSELLIERSIDISDSKARLLSPEDNLLQVALHTAKHSYVRAPGFRLHTDVDRVVRGTNIDWNLFLSRAEAQEVKTAVYFSLAFAHDLLGTPIPRDVLERLRPRRWKVRLISRWLQRVGLFEPDEKKWNRVGYIVFVTLLYDSVFGLLRAIFPKREWMYQRYGTSHVLLLPFLYFHRIAELLVKRTLAK
jgi:hypothetical protein